MKITLVMGQDNGKKHGFPEGPRVLYINCYYQFDTQKKDMMWGGFQLVRRLSIKKVTLLICSYGFCSVGSSRWSVTLVKLDECFC